MFRKLNILSEMLKCCLVPIKQYKRFQKQIDEIEDMSALFKVTKKEKKEAAEMSKKTIYSYKECLKILDKR